MTVRRFEGRRALVTGATGGLGSDVVAKLREEGAEVIGIDREAADGVIAADLTDPASRDAAVAEAIGRLGGLDVLCNVAGVQRFEHIETLSDDMLNTHLAVNTVAPIMIAKACVPALRESKGVIVSVASISGISATPYNVAYGASKAGLALASKVMAIDLAKDGVRVNTVAPGGIETPMIQGAAKSLPADADFAWIMARGSGVLGGMMPPRDVTEAILFLASDAAASITGTELVVDRGTVL